MKSNEIKELRKLTLEDLKKKELELREELFNLQMQRGTSQLANPKRLNSVKKDVARLQTISRELLNQEATASPSEG